MFDYKKPELRQQFDIIALHCEEKYFEWKILLAKGKKISEETADWIDDENIDESCVKRTKSHINSINRCGFSYLVNSFEKFVNVFEMLDSQNPTNSSEHEIKTILFFHI